MVATACSSQAAPGQLGAPLHQQTSRLGGLDSLHSSPKTSILKFSTWNVRTMTTGMTTDHDLTNENTDARKTAIIDTELSLRGIHIAALQETRLAGSGTIKEEHFTFYWFGRPAIPSIRL